MSEAGLSTGIELSLGVETKLGSVREVEITDTETSADIDGECALSWHTLSRFEIGDSIRVREGGRREEEGGEEEEKSGNGDFRNHVCR